MLMAQVKDSSAQPIIVAFGGRQYSRVDWRQVPETATKVEKSSASPFLNFKSIKTAEPAPEPTGELADLGTKELKAIAKDMGMTGFSKLTKPKLVAAIEAAEAEASEESEDAESQDEPDEPDEPDEAEGD